MFKVNETQANGLMQRDESRFVAAIRAEVRDAHPHNRLPDAAMDHDIRTGIGRARGHGLSTDAHLSEYVLIMFEIAPNFDRQPDIARVLARADLSPEARWELLFTAEMDAAWADADRPEFYDARFWWPDDHDFAEDAVDPSELGDEDWGELSANLRKIRENPDAEQVEAPSPDEIAQATAAFSRHRQGR